MSASRSTPRHDSGGDSAPRVGLTVERYAEIMAYRRHFPEARRAEVLLRLGIGPQRWAHATKAWGAALSEALEGDAPDLVLRFAKAFGAAARRLREFPPRIEDLGELRDARALDAEDRAAPGQVPSYLRENALPALPSPALAAPPRPPIPPGATETADISAFVPRQPLPFQPTTAAPRAGMILRRFDPQTGQPLAAPVWEPVQQGAAPEPSASQKKPT